MLKRLTSPTYKCYTTCKQQRTRTTFSIDRHTYEYMLITYDEEEKKMKTTQQHIEPIDYIMKQHTSRLLEFFFAF